MAAETKKCPNCREHIDVANFMMHEVRCPRVNKYCEDCGEAVLLVDWKTHCAEQHVPTNCELCGKSVMPNKMEAHKDECPKVLEKCKYCELDVPRCNMYSHVDACGSRTELCTFCSLRVTLRDMDEHQSTKCGHVRSEEPLDPFTLRHIIDPPTLDLPIMDHPHEMYPHHNRRDPYIVDSSDFPTSHTTGMEHFESDSELAMRLQEEEVRLQSVRDQQHSRSPTPPYGATSPYRSSSPHRPTLSRSPSPPYRPTHPYKTTPSYGATPTYKPTLSRSPSPPYRPTYSYRTTPPYRSEVSKSPSPSPPPSPTISRSPSPPYRPLQSQQNRPPISHYMPPHSNKTTPPKRAPPTHTDAGGPSSSYKPTPLPRTNIHREPAPSERSILPITSAMPLHRHPQRGSSTPSRSPPPHKPPLGRHSTPPHGLTPPQSYTHPHSHTPPHTDMELAKRLQDEEIQRDIEYGRGLELAQKLQQEQDETARRRDQAMAQELASSSAGEVGNDANLPCQFCDQLIPSHSLTLHQNSCHANPDSFERDSATTTTRPSAAVGGEAMIPCETCGKPFSITTLHRHQVKCSSQHLGYTGF